jgi:uncharacterized OB-fold protein
VGVIAELLEAWPPSALTAPYWDAAREGILKLQRCTRCGAFQHPPRRFCLACAGEPAFVEVSGRGTVYSFTVVERALIAALRDHVPYVLVLVELEEGPRMLSLLRGGADPRIGLPVEVGFEAVTADLSLPVFRAAA